MAVRARAASGGGFRSDCDKRQVESSRAQAKVASAVSVGNFGLFPLACLLLLSSLCHSISHFPFSICWSHSPFALPISVVWEVSQALTLDVSPILVPLARLFVPSLCYSRLEPAVLLRS